MFSAPLMLENRVAVQYLNGSATFLGASIRMVVKSNQQHFDSAILNERARLPSQARCIAARGSAPWPTFLAMPPVRRWEIEAVTSAAAGDAVRTLAVVCAKAVDHESA